MFIIELLELDEIAKKYCWVKSSDSGTAYVLYSKSINGKIASIMISRLEQGIVSVLSTHEFAGNNFLFLKHCMEFAATDLEKRRVYSNALEKFCKRTGRALSDVLKEEFSSND